MLTTQNAVTVLT